MPNGEPKIFMLHFNNLGSNGINVVPDALGNVSDVFEVSWSGVGEKKFPDFSLVWRARQPETGASA